MSGGTVYVCPLCQYETPPQPLKINSISHACRSKGGKQVALKAKVPEGAEGK